MTSSARPPAGRSAPFLASPLSMFIGALLVVSIAGVLTVRAANQFTGSARLIAHSLEVLQSVQTVETAIGELSGAMRAYFITGNRDYLQRRDAEKARIDAAINQLDLQTLDDARQQTSLRALREALVRRLSVLSTATATYDSTGIVGVQALSQRPELAEPERDLRAILQQMEGRERMLLDERRALDERRTTLLQATLAVFLLATAAVLTILYLRARRFVQARQAAEREVEQHRHFLESVVENIPNMVFIKRASDLRFTSINRAGEQLLGMPRDALLGKSDFDFFPREQAEHFAAADRRVLESRRMLDIHDEPLRTSSGTRMLHTKKVPILDERGEAVYLLGISEDITQRRAFEQRLLDLNAQLQRNSQQLETANKELEGFTYSVSHDLRAPLRAVDGYAAMLEEECGGQLQGEALRYLGAIRAGAGRMATLIEDLLTFSRLGRQVVMPTLVHTNRLVERVIAELRAADPRLNAAFIVETLPDCFGDDRLLQQVWANLLENAVKYSRHASSPRIQVHGETLGDEHIFSVQDNGVGFDMRYYDKLFNVFQRLHSESEYPGTGVGLAIVQRIVMRHHGRVWAQAQPGRGASFHFALPVNGGTTGTVPVLNAAAPVVAEEIS